MATVGDAPFPVYVSSSLDTALALPVSSQDTVLSLKRQLEQVHADLFPHIGDIIVNAVKIKRGEHMFHLSESIPVRIVFNRLKGCCFLSMDATVAPQQRARRMLDREPWEATRLLQNRDPEEAPEIETNAPVVGVIETHKQPGSEQTADQGKTNQGLEQNVTTLEGSMQRGEASGICKPVKEKKRNMSSQEITEPALCLGKNTRNKRRKQQIEGPSSDREYEVPPVRENESLRGDNVQENNMSSEIETVRKGPKGDSSMTGSPGNAPFSSQYGNVFTETPLPQLEKGRLVPQKDAISDEDTEPDNQLTAEQTTAADGRSMESMENSPRREELADKTAGTSSVNPGDGSPEKRMRKETKATSLETSTQEILAEHNESCKGKESNTSFEIETCQKTGDGLTNGAGKDQNGSSLKGIDAICMAEPVKISSEAGAKNDLVLQGGTLPTGVLSRFTHKEKRRRKTEDSSSESPSDAPLAGERKYQRREVQKSNAISEKVAASKNANRDSSVAGEPGRISSFAPNDRDPKEGSLDEMNFSSQTQVKEKASVPLNAFEVPVSKGEKREERKKLTTPEVLEVGLGSKAHASDRKKSQTKNPRKGKSKEKGRSISLSEDVPKGDDITGEDSTEEKTSVPPNEFDGPVSEGKKSKKRKKVSTPEVMEAGSKAYASEKKESQIKNPRKGKSKENEGRTISLSDDVPKGDGIAGEDSTEYEDEDELGQFRVEFRNNPIEKNGEKMNVLGVEEKASRSSATVFPVQQCRLTGGRNWHCKNEALPGKRICAYHESGRHTKASKTKKVSLRSAKKEVNHGPLLRSSKKK